MKFREAIAEGRRYLKDCSLDREQSYFVPAFYDEIEDRIGKGEAKHEALKKVVSWAWRSSPFVAPWIMHLSKKFLCDLGWNKRQMSRFLSEAKKAAYE